MYKFHLPQDNNKNEYEELIKVFLKSGEYMITSPDEAEIGIPAVVKEPCPYRKETSVKNQIKRHLFQELKKRTGTTPDWGILTGVRPVKLAGELLAREDSEDKVREILIGDYYLSLEKAELILNIKKEQNRLLTPSPPEAVGLYIGIPFCPTRCVYCSFPSNRGNSEEISEYLNALHREIDYTSKRMEQKGWYPESIYIGGGTPTTLTAEQLCELLGHIRDAFDLSGLREFTLEAGRPDTIDLEKLQAIRQHGVERISINPQSMNGATLERIGRNHRPEDIDQAFQLARAVEIQMINTDVIAGLPEENVDDFVYTLNRVLALAPENITVHTLALKRASRLKEIDSDYPYKQGEIVKEMLDFAKERLSREGYRPYYLYRQKQMTGNFENVGYARGDTEGVYNIRIMEEAQTIIALGAGGISKVWYPKENRLERIANVSNYQIYIQRLSEMLQRKEEKLFQDSNR